MLLSDKWCSWHRSREWTRKGDMHEGTEGEIFVEQQLGWNRALAERTSPFKLLLEHSMPMCWSRSERGGKAGVCMRCCVQHREHNLLTWSVSARLVANPSNDMASPRRGDCGPRDLVVISLPLRRFRSLVYCRVTWALVGAIEADGISVERLIPRPTTKIARGLWSRALLLSSSDP